MEPILELSGLSKVYPGGLTALDNVDLTINKGEVFALLGPNGAGKTTLIGAVCGLVRPTSGSIRAFGHDLASDWRRARSRIGLVPQELSTDMFEPVHRAVSYSRGLFGLAPDRDRIEEILRSLSLWDKRDERIMALSGGMKRRVLIAKALAHEPDLLFLDEPTAGVDVELRKGMWAIVDTMRERGVTIILTTHYIEEAEKLCETVSIINDGNIIVTDSPEKLTQVHGMSGLEITLGSKLDNLFLDKWRFKTKDGKIHVDTPHPEKDIAEVISQISRQGGSIENVCIYRSTLEDVFMKLTGKTLQDDVRLYTEKEALLNV